MEILIADDQRTTGLALAWALEGMGHVPRLASSGEEAWALLRKGEWRLVITDWVMPGMSGTDLCRLIRSRADRPYVYTIILTGLSGRVNRLEGLDSGADDFLTKPVDHEELKVRISIARRILGVQSELEERNALLRAMASTDPLTGLANRRGFQAAAEALADGGAAGLPHSLISLDVDHFKSYNDTYGHGAGDEALRAVAAILRSSTRRDDLVARVGGEEFAVLLPETNAPTALRRAEAIRRAVASADWPRRPVTISAGVATTRLAWEPGAIAGLLEEADRALYQSKRSGRDRACHAGHPPPSPHVACA
ncbi:Response regulator PleD [Aquisphaera giovannonii]|uniref:diguanylate cyclase n=1 Tax=Aquisphaera giovannonii TaxID=406548 RepID=A0A5B9W4N4_9BACT|nr:diguanylate cyclase [Aquisphaera giovannonii]QEH34960.1 Response regulator PleD [Aquisphaera giovannonii]